MDDVTVSKESLLKILKENKEKHVQIFNDAIEGARVQYRQLLEKELGKLERGRAVTASVNIPLPTNHEEQYDEVIEMLNMSVDEEITLRRHEFQQYIQDKWITDAEKKMLNVYALSSSNSALYQGN